MKRNKKLEAIQVLHDIHVANPVCSDYDYGLINGLALAISILTETPPRYSYKHDAGDGE